MRKIRISAKQFNMLSKVYRIGGFMLVVSILTTYSYYVDRLIEFIIIFMSYFMTKGRFKYQWHSTRMKYCMFVSIIVFLVATRLTVPKMFSITFSGFIGLAITYISYHTGRLTYIEEKYEELLPEHERIVNLYNSINCFKVTGVSADDIINRCKLLHLKQNQIEFCLRAFTSYYGKCYSDIELADYYCIELQSLKNKKQYYRKKLEKHIDNY